MLKKTAFDEHSYGSIIKKYRDKAGLSQAELANLIGANRNSVFNWENDKNKPDLDIIRRLCPVLHMPIQEFFSIFDTPDHLTTDESILVFNYRSLLPRTKKIISQSVAAAAEEDHRLWIQELRDSHYVMTIENTSAAAGIGSLYSDVQDIQHRFVTVSKLSSRADTLVRVTGRSMEPAYHNGDIVFVLNTDSGNEGEDLICSTSDGLVIKRMDANHQLYSVNPDIPFGQKYEDDHIKIIGRVIGIADSSDFANKDLIPILEDIMIDDIKECEQKHNTF